MPRAMPSYIAAAGVIDAPLKYKWDDEDPTTAYGDEVPRLADQILDMSNRAALVFGCALAEWIAFRIQPHSDDTMLFEYIDAARASSVDLAYTDVDANPEQSLEWSDWSGPIRGPLCGAAMQLGEIVAQLDLDEPCDTDVVYLANLVEFTLPDVKAFRKWRNWAIARLKELAPGEGDGELGDMVPIQALDPESDFDPKDTKKLLREFLQSLEPKANRWLRTPAEMKKAGFKGKAYDL